MVNIKEKIVVFGEVLGNELDSGFTQLLTKAREIGPNKYIIGILSIDSDSEKTPDYVEKVKQYGADELIFLSVSQTRMFNDSVMADALTHLIRDLEPSVVLLSATPFGRSVAARIQYDLQTALTADCLDLYFEDDLLVQVKPSFGDNILCEIVSPKARPQMATVRPNTFKAKQVSQRTQIIQQVTIEETDSPQIRSMSVRKHQAVVQGVADAEVVIAIGRGIQDTNVINRVQQLVKRLNGKVGVTRPMTELNEFSIADQIGQSGTMIAPKVLLNLGISGAMQYTAGIKNAQTIISVNIDDEAPIFAESDFKVVGDAADIVAQLS